MVRKKTPKRRTTSRSASRPVGTPGRPKREKGPKRRVRSPRRWLRGILGLLLLVLPSAGVYILYLDHTIREQFEGKRWSLPARVYGRALELYPGLALSTTDFAKELGDLRYRKTQELKSPGGFIRQGNRFLVHSRGFTFWDQKERPRRFKLVFRDDRVAELAELGGGSALGLIRLDPPLIASIYPAHREDRILVRLAETPPQLIDALVAVEDRAFLEHFGVNPKAIARALWANIQAAAVVQGGSTLTQQLVKNFFLSAERSLVRKINEALMAALLEWRFEKSEILEAYLNEIYLGQDGTRAIHGFGLASQHYFNRPLEQLRLPEVALLVALVRGPSYYNPRRHPQRARERRNLVLDILEAQDFITPEQTRQAKSAALGVSQRPATAEGKHPGFMDLVRRQLRRDYREEDLASEGLKIFTTMDPRVQEAAEGALAKGVSELEKARRLPAGKLEGAVVVTTSEGAEVLAVVGGRRARYAGFNRALDALRPVGSLIKPAVYLSALERHQQYNLLTHVADTPLRLKDAKGKIWSPKNFDGKSHGEVTLVKALAQSYNLATVHLGLAVGIPAVLETLQGLGVHREIAPYPSLMLGAAALTPFEVAQMYQTLAAGGFYTPLRAIREVLDTDGKPLRRYPLTVQQAVDPAAVYLVTTALQRVVSEGTGRPLLRMLPKSLAVAGKTGTTDDLRDSWFAGFTGDRLAIVWLGRDDNRPAHLTGATGALRVWGRLMRRIRPRPLETVMPANVEQSLIDPTTHLVADVGCDGAVPYPFIHGSAPGEHAPCARGTVSRKAEKARSWLRRLFE